MSEKEDDERATDLVSKAKRVLGGVGLLVLLKAMGRVENLAKLAEDLARADRTDDNCVKTLRAAAGRRHEEVLRRAAEWIHSIGRTEESRNHHRAYCLLIAASTGEAVAPVSPEMDELFTRVERLYSVRVEEAHPHLVELQPRLRALDDRFSPRSITDENRDAVWEELLAALAPVIGPDADASVTDPLLRTHSAHNIARLILALRVGLLNEIEYD